MARERTDLQTILENILGSSNVYFQPPTNIQMLYPCIVYKRARLEPEFADNKPYNQAKLYQVTVIDRNPDSLIPGRVGQLPMSAFDRFYTEANLNHDVYNIFF